MAVVEKTGRKILWEGEMHEETTVDSRMRQMRGLDTLVGQLWPDARGVGGEVMREVMSKDRVFLQEVLRDFVTFLARDPKVRGSANQWEKRAHDYAKEIGLESINLDYKILGFDPESEMNRIGLQVDSFNAMFDDCSLVVARGCPTRDDDRLRDTMLSFILYDKNGVIGLAHVSRPFVKDRRYGVAVARTQQYAKTNGRLVEYSTGLTVDPETITEGVGEVDWSDKDNALTQVGRAIFNGVRGYPNIWGGDMDEKWVCRIPSHDIRLIRNFMIDVSATDIKKMFSKPVIAEFENRMISAFIINPKLTMNYALIFGLDRVFLNIHKYIDDGRYFADAYDVPYTVPEIDEACTEIIREEYDKNMSVLANVARFFTMLQ